MSAPNSKNLGGRPKEPNAYRVSISSRVTEKTKTKLKRSARKLGITVGERVRQLIEKHA